MSETSQKTVTTSTDENKKSLTAILYLLQTHLEKFKDEVDTTYAMHQIGEKTPLATKIEQTMENPAGNLHEIAQSIDISCYRLLDKIAINFFSVNKDILSNVYRAKNEMPLHYSIILKEDTPAFRNAIFNFFDTPPIMDLHYKFPIYFQFATEDSMRKINSLVEKIDF